MFVGCEDEPRPRFQAAGFLLVLRVSFVLVMLLGFTVPCSVPCLAVFFCVSTLIRIIRCINSESSSTLAM